MNFINAYLAEVLGNKTLVIYAASFTFVLLGVAISARLVALKRDKVSPATPVAFNPWFLLRDNFMRLLNSLFIVFTVIRFGEEISGKQLDYWACLVFGLGYDYFINVYAERWANKAREMFDKK